MTHRQMLVIALVLVAVTGAMDIAFSAVQPSGREARINAKRHEDGRTEFARACSLYFVMK